MGGRGQPGPWNHVGCLWNSREAPPAGRQVSEVAPMPGGRTTRRAPKFTHRLLVEDVATSSFQRSAVRVRPIVSRRALREYLRILDKTSAIVLVPFENLASSLPEFAQLALVSRGMPSCEDAPHSANTICLEFRNHQADSCLAARAASANLFKRMTRVKQNHAAALIFLIGTDR